MLKNSQFSTLIVLMLENRSFDNALGYLYAPDCLPENFMPPLKLGEKEFYGLNFGNPNSRTNTAVFNDRNVSANPSYSLRATNCPGFDPGEIYQHVTRQLFGDPNPPPSSSMPTMKGFLADYIENTKNRTPVPDLDTVKQIMGSHLPKDMPVLNALARDYAVCDEWFASVPSQTNTNRAFSLTGTSCGLVNNGYLTKTKVNHYLGNDRFKTKTIFNVLHENGFDDWGVFWFEAYPPVVGGGKPYTRNLFPFLEQIPNVDKYFHKFDDPQDGFWTWRFLRV